MWQLFYPFPFYIIQCLLESTYYDFIDDFDLPVPLCIDQGGIPVCYAQVAAIPLERLAIKLQTIVRDEGMGDSKPSDNIFPNKSFGNHISDVCQWLVFNPFGEVVCADQ